MKHLFILGLLSTSLNLFASNEKGNGGDSCEARILEIRNDIKSWIKEDGPKDLKLPKNISVKEYKEKMLQSIQKTKISCTKKELKVGTVEKTCKNFKDSQSAKMECNFERFNFTDEEEQYKLIHHEFAGISGFETNKNSDESDYQISTQISNRLVDVAIKKLSIKGPSEVDNNTGISNTANYNFFANASIRGSDGICNQSLFTAIQTGNILIITNGLSDHESNIISLSEGQILQFKKLYNSDVNYISVRVKYLDTEYLFEGSKCGRRICNSVTIKQENKEPIELYEPVHGLTALECLEDI